MLVAQVGCAFDGLVLVDVFDDGLHVLAVVPQPFERAGDGGVHDLEQAASDQPFVFDQGDVRLDAGRVAVHHESDRAGRRQHGRLRVAVAAALAERQGVVPDLARLGQQIERDQRGVERVAVRAVLFDHPQHGLAVFGVPRKRGQFFGDAGRLHVRLAGHQRGQRGRVLPAGFRVVGQAQRHQQRPQVGIPQPEFAERAGVGGDFLGRVARMIDDDVLRGNADVHRVLEACGIEPAVVLDECEQVEGGEVAGAVVEVHVFGARVGRVDAPRVGAGVPVVDRGIELHARIAALVGGLRDQAQNLPCAQGLARLAARHEPRLPLAVFDHGAHEIVGRAHRIVGVLKEDRAVRGAVDGPVVTGLDQRPGFLLLLGLAPDELDDVGVVGVEDHHLGRAAGFAAGLDDPGRGVRGTHERDRPGRGAAAAQVLFCRPEAG